MIFLLLQSAILTNLASIQQIVRLLRSSQNILLIYQFYYSMQELSLARQIIYQDEVDIKLDKKMQPQVTKIEQLTQNLSQPTTWQDDWNLHQKIRAGKFSSVAKMAKIQ